MPLILGLILISVDALRADRLGPLTPNLQRFAARSVRFSNASAQAPWTLPSMGAAFTSLPPRRHLLTNRFAVFGETERELARLSPKTRTLAEAFKAAGWETAAFTGDAGLDGAFGFSRGFDVYFDSRPFAGFTTTIPMARDWLKERKKPFFLFLHGYDVHSRHEDAEDPAYAALRRAVLDGETLKVQTSTEIAAAYDARAAAADARLGPFLDDVSKMKGVILAVISDHGEELFEHGAVDHGHALYEESLRVVLLLSGPGLKPMVIKDQVRLLDLAPTLLDLAGVKDEAFSKQAQGVSLRPLLEGKPLALDSVAETDYLFRFSKRSLRTSEGEKYILDLESLKAEVYDLKSDPGEKKDLSADKARAARLDARLRSALQAR